MLRSAALTILIATGLGSTALAQEYCINPVPGGEPVVEIEREQPRRIAQYAKTFPGFEGQLVTALQRRQLLQFDGVDLTPVNGDYPHLWGFADKVGLKQGPDDWAYGLGSRPKAIYSFHEDQQTWQRIEGTQDYKQASFDRGSGELFIRKGDDYVRVFEGRITDQTVNLPITPETTLSSIRTLPELSLRLAVVYGPTGGRKKDPKRSLWVQTLNGPWHHVTSTSHPRILGSLEHAEIDIEGDSIWIMPSKYGRPLSLRRDGDQLHFLSALPEGYWYKDPSSNGWISLRSKQTHIKRGWFVDRTIFGPPSELRVLRRDEAGEAQLEVYSLGAFDVGEPPYIWNIKHQSVFGHTVLSSPDGLLVLMEDGVRQIDSLSPANIGKSPRLYSFSDKVYLQSELGVHEVRPDLSVEKIEAFPIERPLTYKTDIGFLAQAGVYVVTDRDSGDVFLSRDMTTFEHLKTDVKIHSIAAILPEKNVALLIGNDRIYRLHECVDTRPTK